MGEASWLVWLSLASTFTVLILERVSLVAQRPSGIHMRQAKEPLGKEPGGVPSFYWLPFRSDAWFFPCRKNRSRTLARRAERHGMPKKQACLLTSSLSPMSLSRQLWQLRATPDSS